MEEKQERRFEDAPLGYKFKRIHEMFRARINEEMKEDDLTCSQMEILFYLVRHKEETPVNQQDLCNAIQVSHPTMIGLLNRMEEKNLVTRRVDPGNRRSRCIEMTPRAMEILQRTRKRRESNDLQLVHGFTGEEIQTLNELLSRVYRNMQSDEFSGRRSRAKK